MLYKVTPMMPEAGGRAKKAKDPSATPRKRRKTGIFDHEGHEVLITLMCLKCRQIKPLAQFGLRKMADGAIRNQPWCRGCRSGAGTKATKDKPVEVVVAPALEAEPMPEAAEPAAVLTAVSDPDETTQPRGEAVSS